MPVPVQAQGRPASAEFGTDIIIWASVAFLVLFVLQAILRTCQGDAVPQLHRGRSYDSFYRPAPLYTDPTGAPSRHNSGTSSHSEGPRNNYHHGHHHNHEHHEHDHHGHHDNHDQRGHHDQHDEHNNYDAHNGSLPTIVESDAPAHEDTTYYDSGHHDSSHLDHSDP